MHDTLSFSSRYPRSQLQISIPLSTLHNWPQLWFAEHAFATVIYYTVITKFCWCFILTITSDVIRIQVKSWPTVTTKRSNGIDAILLTVITLYSTFICICRNMSTKFLTLTFDIYINSGYLHKLMEMLKMADNQLYKCRWNCRLCLHTLVALCNCQCCSYTHQYLCTCK